MRSTHGRIHRGPENKCDPRIFTVEAYESNGKTLRGGRRVPLVVGHLVT
jgi:hypothetical protein